MVKGYPGLLCAPDECPHSWKIWFCPMQGCELTDWDPAHEVVVRAAAGFSSKSLDEVAAEVDGHILQRCPGPIDQFKNVDFDKEFLGNFPSKRHLVCLAGFHFPTGKLPRSGPTLLGASSASEHVSILKKNARDDRHRCLVSSSHADSLVQLSRVG